MTAKTYKEMLEDIVDEVAKGIQFGNYYGLEYEVSRFVKFDNGYWIQMSGGDMNVLIDIDKRNIEQIQLYTTVGGFMVTLDGEELSKFLEQQVVVALR